MTEVPPPGHIIDDKYKWMYENDLVDMIEDTTVKKDGEKVPLLDENKELLKEFIHDARLGKTVKGRAKKKIGRARLVKYIQDLKKLDEYFRKPLEKVTERDMEEFILDLEEGRYSKNNGEAYADETQRVIKHIIIKFYRWIHDDKEKVEDLVGWIDTRAEIKDQPYLRKEQVKKMLTLMTSNTSELLVRNKAAVMFLFDSGVRSNECQNVRLKHLWKDGKNYKVRIEHSKTEKRTLILSMCKDYLETWLDIHPMKDKKEAQLFPMSETALRNMLRRAGKHIDEKVTQQVLRRSSATYWARHLSHYQMCHRFGWCMNSKQPQRYIARAGIDQQKVAEAVEAEDTKKLSRENEELREEMAAMKETMERLLQTDMEEVQRIIEKVKNM